MKKNTCFFLFIVLLFISHIGYGQTDKMDYSQEMKQLKSSQLTDSAIINVWLKIARKISTNKPDSALHFANQAIQVSDKIHWDLGMAHGYYQSGVANKILGNHPTAIADQLQALLIYQKEKDSIGIGNSLREVATIYWLEKNYDKALQYDMKALEIAQKQKNIDKISRALNNIGILLYDKQDYKKALTYYFQALKIAEQLQNKYMIGSTYHNIGETYVAVGDMSRGFEYLHKSLAIGRELNDKNFIANTLIVISEVYQKQGNINESLRYAKDGYALAKQIGAKQYIINASNVLYADYKIRHNMDRALEYHELYITYRDSVYNEKNHDQITHTQAIRDLEDERRNSELLAKETKLQQAINAKQLLIGYFLVAFVLLVLIVLALFIRANSEKKRTNTLLLAQKSEIEQTKAELIIQKQQIMEQNLLLSKNNEKLVDLNNEKDGLVGIVAHDLRAPLNRIKGFAQILGFEENLNEDQLMMLKRIDKTCNAGIALIKDLLIINNIEYESTRIIKTDIEMNIFLKNFMEQFEYQASAKQIKLHLANFTNSIVLQTDENFISRILDNILSNAIKFTHQDKNIYIKCEEIGDKVIISIRDEGQGLSKQDQQKLFIKFQKLSAKPTAGEESTGLGLAIVKALVDKLQGEISVTSKIDEGTEFTIKLPKCL